MNVTINDIKEIETELNITLTDVQRYNVLEGYQRIVMDRAEGWSEIIKHLIEQNINIDKI